MQEINEVCESFLCKMCLIRIEGSVVAIDLNTFGNDLARAHPFTEPKADRPRPPFSTKMRR